MRKWKGLGALLLTTALVCGTVQPVFADGDGAGNPSAGGSETKTEAEKTPGGDLPGETKTDTGAEIQEAEENKGKKETDNGSPDVGTTGQKKADAAENKTSEVEGVSVKTKDVERTESALSVLLEEAKDNDSKIQPLAADNKVQPSVTVDSVTWEGGQLKVPVDLGGYTADEILPVLRFAPENTDTSEWWRYPTIEGDYVVYSPISDFDSCDVETFWTQAGTYNATMEFKLYDTEDLICTDSFTVTIPSSSKLWQVEPKSMKFDGSQDLTFSFQNGTNNYALQSISYIELFMWKGLYPNPSIGRGGFTYDMSAGTLTIDKNLVSEVLRREVSAAMQNGLETYPTHVYLNVGAVTSSGEEVVFNIVNEESQDLILHVPAWELDITDFDWAAEDLKIVPEATDYVYMKGDQGGATIKCTGALQDFVNVYVDGALVDRSNYTLESGSTILTFTAKYLNTLSVGKHTVTMNYTYGSVNTNLTVRARTNSSSSSSGSSSSGSTSNPAPSANPNGPAAAVTPSPIETTVAEPANGSNASGTATSVQTGDSTTVVLWMLSSVFALGICGVLGWKRHSGK